MKYEAISGPQAVRRYLEFYGNQFLESGLINALSPIYGEDEVLECIEYMIKGDVIWRTSPNGQVLLNIN